MQEHSRSYLEDEREAGGAKHDAPCAEKVKGKKKIRETSKGTEERIATKWGLIAYDPIYESEKKKDEEEWQAGFKKTV